MTFEQLKEAIMDIVKQYFSSVPVVWAEQKSAVKQKNGLITLKLRNLTHPIHFIKETQNNAPLTYIETKTHLEVNLYTKGKVKSFVKNGVEYKSSENTALADMMDFGKYLASDYVQELCNRYDISILPETFPFDASTVIESKWEYRAVQEFTVGFTQTMDGKAGISREDWSPTPSGGGTRELAQMEVEGIDPATIVLEEEKGGQ